MAQPSSLLILPARMHPDEENALLEAAALGTQCPEELRLAECIEGALRATGYSVLRDIEVIVNARIIRLVGRVPSYHLKQIAQVTALAMAGTHQIHNDLEVIPLN